MQHFANFGSLDADFGATRTANKQLKRLNEIKQSALSDANIHKLGTLSYDIANNGLEPKNAKSGINYLLGKQRKYQNTPATYIDNPVVEGQASLGYRTRKKPQRALLKARNQRVFDEQFGEQSEKLFGNVSGNKAKKKNWELKNALNMNREYVPSNRVMPNLKEVRLKDIKANRTTLAEQGNRSKPDLIGAVKPDTKNYSDIRKVDDYAAAPTGYLGFQNDPYKGYGGMMEEPVPTTQRKITNRSY